MIIKSELIWLVSMSMHLEVHIVAKDQASQVTQQMYVHVLVCDAPPSQRSKHKDWMRTQCKDNTQLKETQEGKILHKSQSQIKTIHHEITQPASIWEHGFYMNPSVHKTKVKIQKKP